MLYVLVLLRFEYNLGLLCGCHLVNDSVLVNWHNSVFPTVNKNNAHEKPTSKKKHLKIHYYDLNYDREPKRDVTPTIG